MSKGLRLGGVAGLLSLIVCQSGCGTVVNLAWGVEDGASQVGASHYAWGGLSFNTRIYGGIQNDIHGIGEAVRGEEGFWWSVLTFPFFVFIDFPLSLVADTLTLPYTIPCVLLREDRKPSSP